MKKFLEKTWFFWVLLILLQLVALLVEPKNDPCLSRQLYLESDIKERVIDKYVKTRMKSFSKDTVVLLENYKPLSIGDGVLFARLYALLDSNDLILKRKNSDTLYVFRNGQPLGIYRPRFNCR